MGSINTKTSKGRARIMGELVDRIEGKMFYLYNRWQDERKHEDFSDYEEAMKDEVGHGFMKALRRPFGFIIQMDGFPYKARVSVSRRNISWSAIS